MARQYYFYQSLRKTIIQFLDVFSNIRIERLDSEGNTVGYRKVILKFGPKEKVWLWVNQRKDDEMLPAISIILSSVEYASERQVNKMRNVIKSTSYTTAELNKFLNPVPYDFGFTMTIWSLHIVDVDQILEQILPYFTPNIFVRINIPELDATLDLKVLFRGCSPDVNIEIMDEDVRVVKWNLDFIVQGYLFQPLKTSSVITKIIQKFYSNKHSWGDRFTETIFTSGGGNEDLALYTKAIPPYLYSSENVWVANTDYDIGDVVRPTTPNGYMYEVQSILIPGYSGATEPSWPTIERTPVEDNDIIWEIYKHDEHDRLSSLERFGV